MKPIEVKNEYIRLRASGKSFRAIADELDISPSTSAAWDKELKEQIDELKRAELIELSEQYGAAKEARIKNLGETLEKINKALAEVDYKNIDPAKLLDYKLKYTEALKSEYIGIAPAFDPQAIGAREIMGAIGDLLNRTRAGEVTSEQAQKESLILSHLLKAYNEVETKAKLDEIEATLNGRGL